MHGGHETSQGLRRTSSHPARARVDEQPAKRHARGELEQAERRPSCHEEELELEGGVFVHGPGVRAYGDREGEQQEQQLHRLRRMSDEQEREQQVVLREQPDEPQRELRREEPLVAQQPSERG